MATDIRISVDFWHHHKTGKLAREAGLEGVRSLQILWAWTARNRPDGVLSGMDADDIEFAADWRGTSGSLYGVLTANKWVDVIDGIHVIHDWHEHNPWAAESEERSDAARLSRLCRDNPEKGKELRKAGVTGITAEQYKEYKNTLTPAQRPCNESTTERSAPAPAPAPAPTLKGKHNGTPQRPVFIPEELWAAFISNRKFKKLQNTELALKTVCKQIKAAIDQGYTAEECIGAYVSSKWQRFNVEWMKDKDPAIQNETSIKSGK